jgi:hypothetical protein
MANGDPNDPNIQNLGNAANAVSDDIVQNQRVWKAWEDQIKSALSGIISSFGDLDDRIKDNSQRLSVIGGAASDLKKLQDPLDALNVSFLKLSTVMNQTKQFQFDFKIDSSPIDDMSKNMGTLSDIMKKLKIPDTMTQGMVNFVKNAEEAEKLENAFVGLSSSGGELDKVFTSQGGILKDLQALTAAYTSRVEESADITKYSVHQTMDMANALKGIPELSDQLIRTNEENIGVTTSLTAAMTLMSGTGRNQTDVVKALNLAYDNLSDGQNKVNDAAQRGMQYLATVSSISTDLKLKFDDVNKVMSEVAEQFKFVEDNTDASARILGRYTDALRETGLTGKASMEIISKMTSNMKEMEMGTKAFLSIRSGGAGGLQGAFQIEQLMRQGKTDQVMQMAERNLKQQFGGRIYTQAEAAQSPEAASQFMRQRQMLQSGAFGIGKGMGDDQATRLLEALGKGDTLAATKELKTGQDALTNVSKQGHQLQDRTNNYLKDMNRFAERGAIASEITAGKMIRDMMGISGTADSRGNTPRDLAAQRREEGNLYSIGQRRSGMALEAGKPTEQDAADQLLLTASRATEKLVEDLTGLSLGAKSAGKGIVDTIKGAANAAKRINSEREEAPPPHIFQNIPEKNAPKGPSWLNEYMKEAPADDQRKAGVLAQAQRMQMPTHTLPSVAAAARQTVATTKGGRPGTPEKIVLEILAPPGFDIRGKDTEDVTLQFNRIASGTPRIG